MKREAYETPQLVLLGDAEHLVQGELTPVCGDADCNYFC
jgi:hypothetical protein